MRTLLVHPSGLMYSEIFLRAFAESVPEIVHLSVMTPYPGTEIWSTAAQNLTTLDYRLFDIQHAVLPTTLPLPVFYAELVKTQAVINRKHLGLAALAQTAGIAARLLLRGQTNFVRMLWRFSSVYNGDRQLADHQRAVRYELPPPSPRSVTPGRRKLYVHESRPPGRQRRGRGPGALRRALTSWSPVCDQAVTACVRC